MRDPAEAFSILRKVLRAGFEAAFDMKSTQLQSVKLKQSEKRFEYSNRTMELVNELDCAAHSLSDIEQKRALHRGLPKALFTTAEAAKDSGCKYH